MRRSLPLSLVLLAMSLFPSACGLLALRAPLPSLDICRGAPWVDRVEGPWAILGQEGEGMSLVPLKELPHPVQEGDVLLDGRPHRSCTALMKREVRSLRQRMTQGSWTDSGDLTL